MKESNAYRIVEYEKLLAARSAAEDEAKKASKAPDRATTATFEGEPSTTFESKEKPAEPQAHRENGNGRNPMPKSLHGISSMEIRLMAIDGNLSAVEQNWFDRLRGPPIDFSQYGKNAWMMF